MVVNEHVIYVVIVFAEINLVICFKHVFGMLYFFQRIQNVEPSIWMNILFLMISWQVRKIIFLIKLTFGNKSLSNFVLFVLAQSDIKLLKNIHYCRQNNSIRAFFIFLVMLFYFLLQHIQKFLPFLRTFVIIWDTITHI